MRTITASNVDIKTEDDLVTVRLQVKVTAVDIGFSILNQTKIVTVASELARNILRYADHGLVIVEHVSDGLSDGLRMIFKDQGPGIADVGQALVDGYTTGNGLGLGLSGSKRLVDEFLIDSVVGEGTTITAIKWQH